MDEDILMATFLLDVGTVYSIKLEACWRMWVTVTNPSLT